MKGPFDSSAILGAILGPVIAVKHSVSERPVPKSREPKKRSLLFKKEMPRNVFQGGPCAWRYSDYLRTGSIYTLPDDHRLQRGPTIVRLPSGREMRVPATHPRNVQSHGNFHDTKNAQAQMQQLLALLSGKATAQAMPPGIGQAPAGRPEIGRHPFRMPRPHPGLGQHNIYA